MIYIKDIKWLGNPYRHTVFKMQYENFFKVIGVVHVILAFLVLLLLLLKLLGRRLLQVLVLGLLRWINVYSRTHGQKQGNNIKYMQTKANTNKQYNNT